MAAIVSRALSLLAMSATLVACYTPQPMLVASSVTEWHINQEQEGSAAPVESEEGTWSAEALVAQALRANPDLLAWSARVEASAASVHASGAFDDLELRLTRANLHDFERGEPRVDIALRGRPPRPGDIASRKDAARLRVEEISALQEDAKRRIRGEVRRLHAALIFGARERALVAEESDLRGALLGDERARMALSEANKLSVLLAELDGAQVNEELAELALESARAEGALRALIDLPAQVPLTPSGAPGGVVEDAPLLDEAERKGWVAEGLSKRSSLRQSLAALGQARADAHRADAAQWPWFNWVELRYELTDRVEPMDWGVALSLDLPIFAWTGAEAQAADALTRQRAIEHQGSITRVAREVEAAFRSASRARARYLTLQESLRDMLGAEGADKGAGADAQPEDPSLVRRVEIARLQAKRRVLEAHRDWVDAYISLYEAVGR